MANKKITLKNKAGEKLYPSTIMEQVVGINEALDTKLGKTEKAASATNADSATTLGASSYWEEDLNTFVPVVGKVGYYSIIPNTATNIPDPAGYQNSVMSFGLHDNGATAQMFFAKDKPLYYRSSHTGGWQQIATTADVDKAFNYLGYNLDLNEFYDNENKSGTVYVNTPEGAENTTNAPELYGGAVNFGAGVSNFQLFSPAYSNKLYHRNRWWADGGGEWSDWKQLRTINDLVTTSHIATAAITPAKIQTSIALNGTPSMTVEPTTSSPDKTIASVGLVKEVVEDIEIGGRNLVVNSSTPISSTAYFIGNLPLYENLIENSVYTITIWGELGADRTSFYLYPEWGMGGALCELQQVSNGVYNATFIFHKGDATNSNAVGLYQMPSAGTSTSTIERIKIEKGNKATDWTPAPEDINTEISNAETRSKSHAEDYTDAEITKIENGETVAQKANSLYDEDSGDWKIWKDVTNAVGDEVEEVLKQNNFATKDDIQSIIPSNATETGAGIVRAATQAEVNDGHVSDNDPSEMAFVRPETLENYIDSKGFATTSDISDALASAKPAIFFQAAQPAGGKDGDIWIIP